MQTKTKRESEREVINYIVGQIDRMMYSRVEKNTDSLVHRLRFSCFFSFFTLTFVLPELSALCRPLLVSVELGGFPSPLAYSRN